MAKPVIAITYIGNRWYVNLENHESKATDWGETGQEAFHKAKELADKYSCNMEWRSQYDGEGNIIQLSKPEYKEIEP